MLAIMNTHMQALFFVSPYLAPARVWESSMLQNPEIRCVGTTRRHVDLKRGVGGVLVRIFFRQHLQVSAV